MGDTKRSEPCKKQINKRKRKRERARAREKRKVSVKLSWLMAFSQRGNRGEGILLASLPEHTGTPVAFDRDIFTLQTPSGA